MSFSEQWSNKLNLCYEEIQFGLQFLKFANIVIHLQKFSIIIFSKKIIWRLFPLLPTSSDPMSNCDVDIWFITVNRVPSRQNIMSYQVAKSYSKQQTIVKILLLCTNATTFRKKCHEKMPYEQSIEKTSVYFHKSSVYLFY